VLVERGPGGHPQRSVIQAGTLAFSGDVATIRGSIGGGQSSIKAAPAGILNVRAQPRINGDESVTLDARGEVEMVGEASRVRREFDTAITIRNTKSGLLLDTSSAAGSAESTRLLVFASVRVIVSSGDPSIPPELEPTYPPEVLVLIDFAIP